MRRSRRKRRGLAPLLAPLMLIACVVTVFANVAHYYVTRSSAQVRSELAGALAHGSIRIEQDGLARLMAKDPLAVSLKAADLVHGLSTDQKVAQLFFVTPESLEGAQDYTVTEAGDKTRAALAARPVGGIIYFQQNLTSPEQTRELLSNTASFSRETFDIPLLLDVDEEGGTVSRVGGNPGFPIANVGNMRDVGASGNPQTAQEVAAHIGSYLADLGFTADFAPVADIANNPESDTMALRSFGDQADLVADMVAAQVRGFKSRGIICCAKHFPGIGGAEGDSHTGAIYCHKTEEELLSEELVPFAAAIDEGVPMVMVGHISCPELTGTDLPASVNETVMKGLLRDRLGFKGVVITDSLGMGAIVDRFGYDRVAVEAFLAGADALLMPADFDAAYNGMLDAVASGEVPAERLDESVFRIVRMKLDSAQS